MSVALVTKLVACDGEWGVLPNVSDELKGVTSIPRHGRRRVAVGAEREADDERRARGGTQREQRVQRRRVQALEAGAVAGAGGAAAARGEGHRVRAAAAEAQQAAADLRGQVQGARVREVYVEERAVSRRVDCPRGKRRRRRPEARRRVDSRRREAGGGRRGE